MERFISTSVQLFCYCRDRSFRGVMFLIEKRNQWEEESKVIYLRLPSSINPGKFPVVSRVQDIPLSWIER